MHFPIPRRSFLALAALGTSGFAAGQDDAKPDAAVYFAAHQMAGARLSPDGLRVAISVRGKDGKDVLGVVDLTTMEQKVVFSAPDADVAHFVWVSDNRLAFTMAELETAQGKLELAPGLFAVAADGTGFRQLADRQYNWLKDGSITVRMEPWNTFLLAGAGLLTGDDVLAVRPEAYSEKDWGYAKLLRINTRTASSEEIDCPLHAVKWIPDAQGQLRAVVTRNGPESALQWKNPQSQKWQVLTTFETYTGDGDLTVKYIDSDGILYITANRGRDKKALWLLNPLNNEWTTSPLAQSDQYDIDTHIIARQDKVLGLRFTTDREVTQWLDADLQKLQSQIDKALPRTVNRMTVPVRGTSGWVMITAFSDIQPDMFLLFNRETKKFTRLGGNRPDIDAKKMATSALVRIPARDKLEIPSWLTLPPGKTDTKNLPMVVLVHGGPFVPAETWDWNAEVQFLAARGYAVLQPQFRGTQGFGNSYQRAGWKQWGKAMQTDLADATQWAIEQGIADPQRIAIAGASYGGYASLMGLVRNPELFRCAVAWVGVTDLDMLHTVKWDDISDDYKKHGMPKLLGDRIKDAEDLKENSPLTHAKSIKQPLLLAYGSADKRVPLVHGESFRKAVQPGNSAVEWVVYKDEGHGWRVPSNRIDFWNRTARFLDKNLAVR